MSAGMTGRVDHPHRHAAAEIEQVAVPERHGVGPGLVEERRPQEPDRTPRWRSGSTPKMPRKPSKSSRPGRSSSWTYTGASRNSGSAAVWSSWQWLSRTKVDSGQCAPAAGPDAEGRVDEHRRPGALDQQGVVVGVLPAAGAEQDGRGAEPAVFEFGHLSRPTPRRPSPGAPASRCGTRPGALRSPRRRP